MDQGSDPDWAAIRAAVEAGEGSQGEIAARFGVGLSALAMRKFRGGWMSPKDVEKLMKVEAGIDALAAQMMRRLKKSARHADALNARAEALVHARCGDRETLDRLETLARSLNDMQPVLRMTADLTRLMERKARASADLRAAHAALEAKHDRPDFVAFERAVLARLAAAGLEIDLGDADGVGEAADRGVLGGAEDGGADAA
ncbi:MAG: hypothetical protein QM698_05090 [Micropepsaceae bacterium]